jgi:hypothetical protein
MVQSFNELEESLRVNREDLEDREKTIGDKEQRI